MKKITVDLSKLPPELIYKIAEEVKRSKAKEKQKKGA